MVFRQLSLVVCSFVCITACVPKFDGSLTVAQNVDFVIRDSGADSENITSSALRLYPGSYKTVVKMMSNEQLLLEIDHNIGKQEVEITLPKGTILPELNGAFAFDAADLKQDFSVVGELRTDIQKSELKRELVFCSNPPPHCYMTAQGQQCETSTRGVRRVEYYIEKIHANLEIKVFSRDGLEQTAKFNGVNKVQQKRFTQKCGCVREYIGAPDLLTPKHCPAFQ